MSWACVEDKFVVTKKPHSCCICGEKIPAGTRTAFRKGVSEDGWASMYMHEECNEFSSETYSYEDWDCSLPGDVSRKEVIDWMNARYRDG
jgi:hypothetical protein